MTVPSVLVIHRLQPYLFLPRKKKLMSEFPSSREAEYRKSRERRGKVTVPKVAVKQKHPQLLAQLIQ